MTKKFRIYIALSIAWFMFVTITAEPWDGYNTGDWLLWSVLPVLAFWLYRFVQYGSTFGRDK